VGSLAPTLRALRDAMAERAPRRDANGAGPPRAAAEADGAVPLPVPVAAAALVGALPEDAVVVEEAVTSGRALRAALRPERRGSYHHAAGGALGWGLGAAVGVRLGEPGRPVLGVLGDGAAAYGIQALWTAAHDGVDAVFAILANGEYRAVKQGLVNLGADLGAGHPGTELDAPAVDWRSLAAGFGVPSARPTDAAGVADAVAEAFRAGGPRLVEVAIEGLGSGP
jgi:benzoylformate decarboxylase